MTRDDMKDWVKQLCPEIAGWQADLIVEQVDLAVAAEREKVAAWMIERGYATGHGDTIENLLKELEWQVKERELKVCAEECEDSLYCAAVTRSRGNTGIKWEIEP
jgi:hypothetical protein